MSATELTVPHRFRGPERSGNGGWSAGALAALATPDVTTGPWPAVEVTLRRPPPLEVAMTVAEEDGATVLRVDDGTVAEARPVDDDVAPVEPVPAEEAGAARSAYPGLRSHPFPGCFTCGVGREEADGLRIFPGRVADASDGGTRVASTWTPHASLQPETVGFEEVPRAPLPVAWAALDCTGGWAGDLEERLMVLGRMTAAIDALPVIGEEHVVVGQRLGTEGRRTFTAATLYDSDGRVVGRARHVWVAIDPATFGR